MSAKVGRYDTEGWEMKYLLILEIPTGLLGGGERKEKRPLRKKHHGRSAKRRQIKK
jgi:hypothetical protein